MTMPPVQACFLSAAWTVNVFASLPFATSPHAGLPLSDNEVDFLWWFIQGSIMDADVRARLCAHWGMCPRHALAFFAVEAAFRPHLIHGSTILYHDLMKRALHVLGGHGLRRLAPAPVVRRSLHVWGPCHMCSLGYVPGTVGNAPAERLAQGRNLANARAFAHESRRGWLPHVCGQCAGTGTGTPCRCHLIEMPGHDGGAALRAARASVADIATHLARFENAFRWDSRGTDTDEDRGALIAAIGWCGGWSEILNTFGAG